MQSQAVFKLLEPTIEHLHQMLIRCKLEVDYDWSTIVNVQVAKYFNIHLNLQLRCLLSWVNYHSCNSHYRWGSLSFLISWRLKRLSTADLHVDDVKSPRAIARRRCLCWYLIIVYLDSHRVSQCWSAAMVTLNLCTCARSAQTDQGIPLKQKEILSSAAW